MTHVTRKTNRGQVCRDRSMFVCDAHLEAVSRRRQKDGGRGYWKGGEDEWNERCTSQRLDINLSVRGVMGVDVLTKELIRYKGCTSSRWTQRWTGSAGGTPDWGRFQPIRRARKGKSLKESRNRNGWISARQLVFISN